MYSIAAYGSMVTETPRTEAFVEALRRNLPPGGTVLDIGTGTGFFALMAARLGASKVYAVETDAGIEIGRRCAARLPEGRNIEWIRGDSRTIELPNRVDLVLGDLRGTLPLFPGNLDSLLDARRRHLKPGGAMLPWRDRIWIAPASAESEYRRVEIPWVSNPYGLDLTPGREAVVNTWWRARRTPIAPGDFVLEPQVWADIDYHQLESPHASGNVDWVVSRAGRAHGFYAWFDTEIAPGLGYSNSPLLPELVYGRAFFPFERPLDLAPGQSLHVDLRARLVGEEYVFHWKTTHTAAGGGILARYRQDTMRAKPLAAEDLPPALR